MKTVNELVANISTRVRHLADEPIDSLRRAYPETTETAAELVKLCKDQGLTRGQMIEAILVEEFVLEFDQYISDEGPTQ